MNRRPSMFAALWLVATGCNNCEKLTDSICTDLGADDCAIWKEIGGPEAVVPGGRGVNRACGSIRDNEVAYQATSRGQKGMVIAERLKRAVAAGDKVAQAKAAAELEENKKLLMSGLPK